MRLDPLMRFFRRRPVAADEGRRQMLRKTASWSGLSIVAAPSSALWTTAATAAAVDDAAMPGAADLFRSLRELKATVVPAGSLLRTQGYARAGDGGHATYMIQDRKTYGRVPDEVRDHTLADGSVARLQSNGRLLPSASGAAADGRSDDTSAIRSLWGAAAYLSSGTYRITATLEPGANTVLAGDPGSVIRFGPGTVKSGVDFAMKQDRVVLSNLAVDHAGVAGESAQMFDLRASGVRLSGLEISGNHTNANDNGVNALRFSNARVENVRVSDCDIHNVNRVILRANQSTGSLNNFWFERNHCHDLGQGGAQFNFPRGEASDVAIVDNVFSDFHGGTEQIFIGGASLMQSVIARNFVRGRCKDAIHLEEGASDIVIAHNVVHADGNGLFIGDNSVGGESRRPSRIIVADNVFRTGSGAGQHTGILASEDRKGTHSYESLIVANNQIHGYRVGINLGLGVASVQGNIIDGCTIGMRGTSFNPNVSGNIIRNASTAISVTARGGLIGKNTFANCTVIVATDHGEKLSMTGFIINIDRDIALPGGEVTQVDTGIDIGFAMHGSLKLHLFVDRDSYLHRLSVFRAQGGKLTEDVQLEHGSGPIEFLGFSDARGRLVILLRGTDRKDRTLKGASLDFDGLWVSRA